MVTCAASRLVSVCGGSSLLCHGGPRHSTQHVVVPQSTHAPPYEQEERWARWRVSYPSYPYPMSHLPAGLAGLTGLAGLAGLAGSVETVPGDVLLGRFVDAAGHLSTDGVAWCRDRPGPAGSERDRRHQDCVVYVVDLYGDAFSRVVRWLSHQRVSGEVGSVPLGRLLGLVVAGDRFVSALGGLRRLYRDLDGDPVDMPPGQRMWCFEGKVTSARDAARRYGCSLRRTISVHPGLFRPRHRPTWWPAVHTITEDPDHRVPATP